MTSTQMEWSTVWHCLDTNWAQVTSMCSHQKAICLTRSSWTSSWVRTGIRLSITLKPSWWSTKKTPSGKSSCRLKAPKIWFKDSGTILTSWKSQKVWSRWRSASKIQCTTCQSWTEFQARAHNTTSTTTSSWPTTISKWEKQVKPSQTSRSCSENSKRSHSARSTSTSKTFAFCTSWRTISLKTQQSPRLTSFLRVRLCTTPRTTTQLSYYARQSSNFWAKAPIMMSLWTGATHTWRLF